jgi:zona occludens toxin
MPINAFGGGPGSGKTYGVMAHVILPAIAKGRFVITNIDGLKVDEIYDYVAQEFYKGKIFCIGHIRTCDRNAPEADGFFPGEDALDKAMPVPSPGAPVVVGGDLVVIDEATRYWATGEKVSKAHAYFFREHRHFANEMGHTCDLVVIDPDLTLLARALKGKVEMSSITHKPKELGLNRYVVKLFRGVKLTGKPVSVAGPHKFAPEVYNLYRSYAVEGAKEQAIDGRQSLLPQLLRKLGFLALVAAVSIGGLVWVVMHKVNSLKEAKGGAVEASAAAGGPVVVPNPVRASGGPVGASAVPYSASGSGVSASLRVAGEVVLRGERWVLLSDGSRVRLENPAAFAGRGVLMVGNVQGQRVTAWSGADGSAGRDTGTGAK